MTKNDCDVFVEGFETIHAGKDWHEYIDVRIGEENGLWGFSLDIQGRLSGMCKPLGPRDLKYISRQDACKNAIERLKTEAVWRVSKPVLDEIIEKLSEKSVQLELF